MKKNSKRLLKLNGLKILIIINILKKLKLFFILKMILSINFQKALKDIMKKNNYMIYNADQLNIIGK